MSYILDALRKSEQQRQATQPENVTDRILVNQPPPQPKRSHWLVALIVGNVLIIAALAWYFGHKQATNIQQKQTVSQEIPALPQTAEQQSQKQEQIQQPQPKLQQGTPPMTVPTMTKPANPVAPSPSIAQLIENTRPVEAKKPVKKLLEKKPQPVKKELAAKAAPVLKSRHEPIDEVMARDEAPERPLAPPKSTGTPDLNELPYEVRNNLPSLNVNVFSYAHQPQDRFVIIDMVKYKTGQLVKGKVKLKEIRPDSVLMENTDGSTFKVERP